MSVGRRAAPMVAGRDSIETEIAGLADLDLDALRLRWQNLCGRAAPEKMPRAMLAKVIAWRRQAEAFGDLDPKAVQMLKRLASEGAGSGQQDISVLARARALPAPGSLLVREWKGEIHRVTVMREGFAWNGRVHASLSRVAKEITGVNWNGFVFFGLGPKAKQNRGEGRAA